MYIYINTTYANIHIQTCHVCLVAGIFVLLCVMTRNLHGQGIIVDVLRNTADWCANLAWDVVA